MPPCSCVRIWQHRKHSGWRVCSVADAYGFGPERMKKFFVALQENNDEITRMEKEVDTDYAYEKLRLKAERVTGMKIEYLYEHEAQENEA